MVVWQRINETLAVLAWPTAVVVVLVVFRVPLRRLIGRVKWFEMGGNRVSLEQEVTTEVNAGLTPVPSDQAADVDPESGTDVQTERADDSTGIGIGSPESETPEVPREVVEDVARTFARAGWRLGASGEYADAPEPRLSWGDDGQLRLVGWSGAKSRTSPPSPPGDAVARLEQEIRDLDLRIKSRSNLDAVSSLVSMRPDGEAAQLEELRERLREIDPASPWAWTSRRL